MLVLLHVEGTCITDVFQQRQLKSTASAGDHVEREYMGVLLDSFFYYLEQSRGLP